MQKNNENGTSWMRPPINDLYKKCYEKYSLVKKQFCSLEDFHQEFQINDRTMLINLLNLTCVDGDKIRPKELWDEIHKLDDNEIWYKDFLKDQNEFNSLGFLLSIYPYFYFKKSEKPDFILRNKEKDIGLEVTSPDSIIETQVNLVAKFNFGRNKTTEEIQEYVRIKHHNIIDKFGLYDANGITIISPSTGLVDCHSYKNMILKKALSKAKKIKNYFSFPEMWLLIDTKDNVCFNKECDAIELSNLFERVSADLASINKILVINVINKALMIYDVKRHEYKFIIIDDTFVDKTQSNNNPLLN